MKKKLVIIVLCLIGWVGGANAGEVVLPDCEALIAVGASEVEIAACWEQYYLLQDTMTSSSSTSTSAAN